MTIEDVLTQGGQIIKGHVNEVLGLNQDIAQTRINICKVCPIYSTKFGGICNNKLYLNPENNDVSFAPKEGYVRGCACRVQAKASIPSEHCVAGKW